MRGFYRIGLAAVVEVRVLFCKLETGHIALFCFTQTRIGLAANRLTDSVRCAANLERRIHHIVRASLFHRNGRIVTLLVDQLVLEFFATEFITLL